MKQAAKQPAPRKNQPSHPFRVNSAHRNGHSWLRPLNCALIGLFLHSAAQAQVAANNFNYARASAFEYNASTGAISAEIVEPDNVNLCVRTEYTYDNNGNKISATTKNCTGASGNAVFTQRSSTSSYAANTVNLITGQFPTSSSNALSQSEAKQYDPQYGQLTQLTGPNGLTTTWQYDSFGRKIKEIRADGTRTQWDYYYCTGYAPAGVTAMACPASTPHTLVWYAQVTPQNSAGTQNGPQSKSYYDTLGREVRSETQGFDSSTIIALKEYDSLGRLSRSSAPYFASASPIWTIYTYDELNRPVRTDVPDPTASGGIAVSTFNYNGMTSSVTNALGQTQTKEKTSQGQIARMTDTKGNQIAYQYDAFGNLLKTVDPLGNTTNLSYDIRGRKIGMQDPDMGNWSYAYNALGELASQTNAKLETTSMTYDLLGRMLSKIAPDLNSYYAYDKYADNSACTQGIGKLCETWAGNGYRKKVTYDTLGRPIQTQTTNDAIYVSKISYDSQGRVDTQTWPTGFTIKHLYNTLGFLTQINNAVSNAMYWQALQYNARGQLVDQKYGNNVETLNTYEPTTGRLTQITAGTGNGVQNHSYTYDAVSNLTGRTDANTNVIENFGYDSLNRLTSQTVTASSATRSTVTWAYNALGNITSQSEVGAYTYNASGVGSTRPHAVTSITGTNGVLTPIGKFTNPQYTYDADGNITYVQGANGQWRSSNWTSFDMPGAISTATATVGFWYSSDNARIKEQFSRVVNGVTKNRTVWQLHPGSSGLYFEREQKEDATYENRHYVGGILLIKDSSSIQANPVATNITPTQIRYWHKDHLGSTAILTDENGAVTERLAYDPFGKRRFPNGAYDANQTIAGQDTNRGFTGHEHLEDFGLIHMNGRIFDPTIGRFLSADPYIQYADNLQSYNRFAYLLNNPLNGTDPTGFFSLRANFQAISKTLYSPTMKNTFDAFHSMAGQKQVDNYVMTHQWAYSVGKIVVTAIASFFTCGAGGAAAAAAWDTYYGYQATGSVNAGVKAGAITFATSMAFYAVGEYLPANTMPVANTLGHAAVGCASAAASGGSCGAGALAAGLPAAIGPVKGLGPVGNLIAQSVIGGTASVLGGGKFENGAVTAAFGYLFNYCAHNGCFDKRFDFNDAVDQWRNGNGSTVTGVNASELNLNDATYTKNKDGTYQIHTSLKYDTGAIYGTVTGVLNTDGTMSIKPDTYNFDIKWSQGASFRNFATAAGAVVNGFGKRYDIEFTGTIPAPRGLPR